MSAFCTISCNCSLMIRLQYRLINNDFKEMPSPVLCSQVLLFHYSVLYWRVGLWLDHDQMTGHVDFSCFRFIMWAGEPTELWPFIYTFDSKSFYIRHEVQWGHDVKSKMHLA